MYPLTVQFTVLPPPAPHRAREPRRTRGHRRGGAGHVGGSGRRRGEGGGVPVLVEAAHGVGPGVAARDVEERHEGLVEALPPPRPPPPSRARVPKAVRMRLSAQTHVCPPVRLGHESVSAGSCCWCRWWVARNGQRRRGGAAWEEGGAGGVGGRRALVLMPCVGGDDTGGGRRGCLVSAAVLVVCGDNGAGVGGDVGQRGRTSSGSGAGRRPPHMDGRGRRKGRGGGRGSESKG